MGEIVEEWVDLIAEWITTPRHAIACGLAHVKDGAIFAAATMEGDPVDAVYKAPYEAMLPQEDGTEKATLIEEPALIKAAAETLRAPSGLWLGGTKFKVVRSEASCEHNELTFKTIFCVRPKGGCHVVITPGGLIVLAIYSEEKGQAAAGVKLAALNFAEYLATHGY